MFFEIFPMTVGFLGSLHCLGMCGPLVMACSIHIDQPRDCSSLRNSTEFLNTIVPPQCLPWRLGLVNHLALHFGRLFTYGVLGALAAGFFHAADLSRLLFNVRDKVILVGGALLILAGLALLKILPLPAHLAALSAAQGAFIGRKISPLLRSRGPGSKFIVGLLLGLMPCCLSWAMIVTAAVTRSPLQGFLTMIAFGVGTLPALLFTGLCASLLSLKVRLVGERAAALSVVTMGLILVFKGVGILA